MQKGFTIIEVIVAIFILSVAVVGVFSAFSIIVILTSTASNRLTAAYLAQEGVETVRNIRDNNWLTRGQEPGERKWYEGLEPCFSACEVDYKTTGHDPNWTRSWVSDGAKLKIDLNGFYNYENGTDTKFKRKIIIECPGSPSGLCADENNDMMMVSVEVFWDEKPSILNSSGFGSIMVEETLYNWY